MVILNHLSSCGVSRFDLDDDIPVRELWCAVIEQAFEDLKLIDKVYKCDSRNQQNRIDYESAVSFFKSESFEQICECLGIDSTQIKTEALK